MANQAQEDFSIIALDKFIQATRDSGYKGTPSAISELVDNAIQAGATEISIQFKPVSIRDEPTVEVSVIDNGSGMNHRELRTALRFGGSSRFNYRGGLGRYGMGLPNSSFSQAQRVTVHTWQGTGSETAIMSYLDLREIASGAMKLVPEPIPSTSTLGLAYKSGTVVIWSECDRLDNKRISTLKRKLLTNLGRKFRHFIWRGVKISVNDEPVLPFDPLYLNENSLYSGGQLFAKEISYELSAGPNSIETGIVTVRFSELPVHKWAKLKNEEKRVRGISKGAGMSIVRGGREVDYGWFLFGEKRRENYDDWWRCELHFEPILDEAFGITHTKQQVRPQPYVLEALTPDLETIARTLNSRARRAHYNLKLAEKFTESERQASTLEPLLTPLPKNPRARDTRVLNALGSNNKQQFIDESYEKLQSNLDTVEGNPATAEFRIVPKALNETAFYEYALIPNGITLVLNPNHPFYKLVYKPLLESEDTQDSIFRSQLELLLFAAARSEALLVKDSEIETAEALRRTWSDTLATYLKK
jgi:hypothetical protein